MTNNSAVQFRSKSLDEAPAPDIIPASERATVVPVRAMRVDHFRLHLEKRHPRVRYAFISHHDQDHDTNPSLDHTHRGETL
jgi:hypothetical protein